MLRQLGDIAARQCVMHRCTWRGDWWLESTGRKHRYFATGAHAHRFASRLVERGYTVELSRASAPIRFEPIEVVPNGASA